MTTLHALVQQFVSLKPLPCLPQFGHTSGPIKPPFFIAPSFPHLDACKRMAVASLSSLILLAGAPSDHISAHASIPLTAQDPTEQRRQALTQLGAPLRRQVSSRPPEDSVKVKVQAVLKLMSIAEEASKSGDYETALSAYNEIIKKFPDLALAERARIPRALLLYQVGRSEEALLQLEDEQVELRISPEVDAALAVVLHQVRPLQVGRSESLWERATELDTRWGDLEWVAQRWPPKMVESLEKFLTLQ